MTATFRAASVQDCHQLVSSLRAHDRAEVEASKGGLTAEEMVEACGSATWAISAFAPDGGLICIFGVSPHPAQEEVGIPWLLGTDLLDRYGLSVCKLGRYFLPLWHRVYPVLTNYTDMRNKRVLRWLQWLGFHFVRQVPVGPHSTPFIQFIRHV